MLTDACANGGQEEVKNGLIRKYPSNTPVTAPSKEYKKVIPFLAVGFFVGLIGGTGVFFTFFSQGITIISKNDGSKAPKTPVINVILISVVMSHSFILQHHLKTT